VGRARQARIYQEGVSGRRPRIPVAWARLEQAARRAMSRAAYAYVAGAAGLEETMAANREGFGRWRIVPRVLRDVSARDPGIELFGRRLPAPLLLCPVGVLEMAHPEADVAVARAAAAEGVPLIISNQASRPMEEIAAAMGDAPRWFQLYWSTEDSVVESLGARAEACGCEAIVVTLDTTMLGWRPRDLDLAWLPFAHGLGIAQYTSDPAFGDAVGRRIASPPGERPVPRPTLAALRTLIDITRAHPGGFLANLRSPRPRATVETFLDTYSRPSLTWADLAFVRSRTRLPILLKGVLHPDDAVRALAEGADGIVVSNHGGRQVDGAIAAIDALPAVAEAVAGRAPVLLDSGVRSGADAFKALALGASAVCIGRPYVYGLALGGSDGVRDVIANLVAELDLTMGLSGLASVSEIGRDALVPAPA
jgi:isopentenyl diphosphate isomerase/L-lactate dehydrogenase-like FMN-dependent dehydrogenase